MPPNPPPSAARRLLASIGAPTPGLLLALGLYAWLCATTVTAVGLVGEVAIGWALPSPPRVLVSLDPPDPAAPAPLGPLQALQTRPVESVASGGLSAPLAINAYTGGYADWPARLVRAALGLDAGRWTPVALGALFLALAHRFLRFHGTPAAMEAVALLLATDWTFVFYRKVLAGTELALLAAGLLVIWALWSRRWKGGVHGTPAIAVGVGLGVAAKATFVATLGAFGIAALAMRWDRAGLLPPTPVRRGLLLAIPLVLVSPLLVAALHHAALPPELLVRSHDTLAVQLDRLTAAAPAREGWANLAYFLGNPLAWFHAALRGPELPALSPLRLLGFAVTLVGVGMEWRSRTASPSAALLRFLSLAVPLQIGALFLSNHDLHHLAQATPPLLLLVALAADRVAGAVAPPRTALRTLATLLLVSPHVVAGVVALRGTDAVIAALPASTFTEAGQAEVIAMVRAAGATRVVTSDYEVYGMAEVRAPEVEWVHTWGAMSRADRDPAAVLRLAKGGWYLALRPTAPMVYNWRPDPASLATLAAEAGVSVTAVDRRRDAKGEWATLYRVE